MVSHALWIVQCSQHLYECYDPCLTTFHRQILGGFDDILVFSKSKEEHLGHLRQVFVTLRVAKLYVNLKKCSFMQTQVFFLGFVVSAQGIAAHPEKVEATP